MRTNGLRPMQTRHNSSVEAVSIAGSRALAKKSRLTLPAARSAQARSLPPYSWQVRRDRDATESYGVPSALDVVQPGPPPQVDTLTDCRVQNPQNPRPDAHVRRKSLDIGF